MFPPIKQTFYHEDNPLANSFKHSVVNHNLLSKQH